MVQQRHISVQQIPKPLLTFTGMGGVKSQEREIFIFTATIISSPACYNDMYLLTNCVI
jgi:hypothetical protein